MYSTKVRMSGRWAASLPVCGLKYQNMVIWFP